MKRRPWLALVVLILIGINATLVVHAGRRVWRPDDTVAAFHLDDDRGAWQAPVPIDLPVARVAIVVTTSPHVPLELERDAVIAIAPKTSPPRC